MTELNISKLDKAESILNSTIERFTKMREIIGPSGSLPMLLMDTSLNDAATDIAVLFDELNTDIVELQTEIKRENHGQ